jgi:transposase
MAARRGSTVPAARPGSRSVAELEDEIARLRRELAIERMEKEVLKKATAYFARESLPGTRN